MSESFLNVDPVAPRDYAPEVPVYPEYQAGVERPSLHVQWRVSLGSTTVNVERYVPLGDTTEETMAHMEALIVTPGQALAQVLIAAYFHALDYATGVEES